MKSASESIVRAAKHVEDFAMIERLEFEDDPKFASSLFTVPSVPRRLDGTSSGDFGLYAAVSAPIYSIFM